MACGWFLSYWQLPFLAAAVWFGTLLAMMVVWLAQGKPQYVTMEPAQDIAYVSDIGATGLQPLFIAGSTVAVVIFDLAFLSERWLRHKGRLAHNTSKAQKVLSVLASVFAIIGAAGLILLTAANSRYHRGAHYTGLGIFVAGYIISAIFICAEYQRLGMKFREYRVLRISFWTKLAFIFIELALVIAFGVQNYRDKYNSAAILEWTVCLGFICYMLSFVMDFIPAVGSKHDRFPTAEEMAMAQQNGPSVSGGPVFREDPSGHYANPASGAATPAVRDSYSSGQPMVQNGGEPAMYPARNF